MLLPVLAFVIASVVVGAAAYAFAPGGATAIDRRLADIAADRGAEERAVGASDTAKRLFGRLGRMAPQSTSETGKIRQRLIVAGFRSQDALIVFFGIRVAIAVAVFALLATPVIVRPNLAMALAGCGFAYVVPGMVLARLAKRRQHRIRLGLPDALDLLVVSVEAGLGLDQAIQRVGDELAFAHKDLCDELRLINLELRAGKARSEALRNLGERTGVDDVQSLVAMLVQTDKFGTSVAQSLRVHSDTVRTKRRQRAEEAAAKTGVKMVFPLVFCIFPAIWVVTIGPAAIKFVKVLGPLMRK
ncbi:MAG: type II secretion system F family protein [Betaproteobacteria bacterium]